MQATGNGMTAIGNGTIAAAVPTMLSSFTPCRVTPCYSSDNAVPLHPSLSDNHANLFGGSAALLINQDIVLGHAYYWTLILQPIYKRLPQYDVIRLLPGKEIIVVIPAIGAKTPDDIARFLGLYAWRFKGVVNKILQLLHPGD
jgi:hypothetical protein